MVCSRRQKQIPENKQQGYHAGESPHDKTDDLSLFVSDEDIREMQEQKTKNTRQDCSMPVQNRMFNTKSKK
jgi:hypothetical protein